MAGRMLSRRALRDENDQVERIEEEAGATGEPDAEPEATGRKPRARKSSAAKTPKVKAPAKPRVRKKSVKAAPRMFARWAVCDGALKHMAVFEYKDRTGADDKLAEMLAKKPGSYYLLLVKVPYDPPAVVAV